MAYMSDLKKIEYLMEYKYFKYNNYLINDIKIKYALISIIKQIKAEVVFYILSKEKNLTEELDEIKLELAEWINTSQFTNENILDKNGKEKKISHDYIMKEYIKKVCIQSEDSTKFNILYKEIHEFLNQYIYKPSDNKISNKFCTDNTESFKILKYIIAKLTNINIKVLNAENEDKFKSLLIIGIDDGGYDDVKAPKRFDKFKLKKVLRNNYLEKDILVLEDFENYLNIPDFIDHTILEKKQLKKTLFIEG